MSEIQKFKDQQILLPNGISAQVLSSLPPKNESESSNKPPLVFLHGGFHAAWCWTEKFFPYFVSLGYPVVAFSWRGTSGTPAREGVINVKVEEHKEDLQELLDQLTSILGPTFSKNKKPVLLSHSLGGALVVKYLEGCKKKKPSDQFSGLITMCSIPPSGHRKMTMRVLWRSIFDAWKIVKGIPMKKAITDPLLCRQLFFGGKPRVLDNSGTIDDFGISDADVSRYQSYFARDSMVATDMSGFAKNPPKTDVKGRSIFVSDLPPALVIGAKDDFLVDFEANVETAKYYGLQKPVIVDSPHDVMLGRKWQNCAATIHHWIEENVVSKGN